MHLNDIYRPIGTVHCLLKALEHDGLHSAVEMHRKKKLRTC